MVDAKVMTIGYGGKKPDNFFVEHDDLKPDMVVDVRQDPFHAFLGVYTKRGLELRLVNITSG